MIILSVFISLCLQIVMECCEGGAINDIMMAIRSPLNEAQAKEVIAHVLLALLHCHDNRIIHRVSTCTRQHVSVYVQLCNKFDPFSWTIL